MNAIRTTIAALGAVALTACGGQAPTTPAPASQAPESPASDAPASTSADKAPTSSNDQLVLSGTAAGMTFKVVSGADKEKAGQLGDMLKNMKVTPAECQQVFTLGAELSKDTSAGSSIAQSDMAAYGAGVGKGAVSPKQVKAIYTKCGTMTLDFGQGMSATSTAKVADDQVAGAAEVVKVSTSIDVAGQKQATYTKVGLVRGLTVSAMGMSQADEAKVDEVFAAQVEKVVQAK